MTSSQKKPPSQEQPYPLDTAIALQQHAFAATVPNMIPRLAATLRENTSSRVSVFPTLEVKNHGTYPDMPPIVSRSPGNAYAWLGPHSNISPLLAELPSPPAMYSNTFGLGSDLTKVNLVSHNSNAQIVSLPVLLRKMQDVPSVGNMVKAVPSPSKRAGKTVSRLPSNDAPRKAPLQGKSCAGVSIPKNTNRKFPKPRQQRSTSQSETPTKATTPVQKRRPSPNDERPGASVQFLIVLSESGKAKKRPRDNHDESHDVEIVEMRKKGGDETENKNNTAGATSSDKAHNNEEKTLAKVPRSRPAKKRATRATSPTQSSHRHKRPIYDYEVPLEVEGTRKALGKKSSLPLILA